MRQQVLGAAQCIIYDDLEGHVHKNNIVKISSIESRYYIYIYDMLKNLQSYILNSCEDKLNVN